MHMYMYVCRLKNDPTLEHPLSPGGATPLHIAAAKGYVKVMKYVECGVCMRACIRVIKNTQTAWTLDINILYSLNFRILVSMKVDVDALDDDGWTPLHASVYWGMMEAAEVLVSYGADITKKTKAVSQTSGERGVHVCTLSYLEPP